MDRQLAITLLTIQETAKAMKVSCSTVQRLITSEELTSIQIGRSRRVTMNAIQLYIRNKERSARQGTLHSSRHLFAK